MATQILRVPRSVEGCVVECGSFKDGSAANLSLICDLCNRRLTNLRLVRRSSRTFQIPTGVTFWWTFRRFIPRKGSLPRRPLHEVQANISRYGKISACNFNAGYFDQTLPHFSQKCVLDLFRCDSGRFPRDLLHPTFGLSTGWDATYLPTKPITLEIARFFFS